jgi:hypothetical protein
MTTQYLISARVPNGYSGDMIEVHYVYNCDTLSTECVWHGGFFNLGLPKTFDAYSALNQLLNHDYYSRYL